MTCENQRSEDDKTPGNAPQEVGIFCPECGRNFKINGVMFSKHTTGDFYDDDDDGCVPADKRHYLHWATTKSIRTFPPTEPENDDDDDELMSEIFGGSN